MDHHTSAGTDLQRTAAVMLFRQHKPIPEVAEELGLSEQTVTEIAASTYWHGEIARMQIPPGVGISSQYYLTR